MVHEYLRKFFMVVTVCTVAFCHNSCTSTAYPRCTVRDAAWLSISYDVLPHISVAYVQLLLQLYISQLLIRCLPSIFLFAMLITDLQYVFYFYIAYEFYMFIVWLFWGFKNDCCHRRNILWFKLKFLVYRYAEACLSNVFACGERRNN